MSNRIARSLVAVALACAPIAACAKHDDATFVAERDRAVAKMSAELTDLDVKITSLRADLSSRSSEAKVETSATLAAAIAKLELERVAAGDALSEAKHATKDRWKDLEIKTDDTLERYRRAYEAATTELER